MSFMVGTKYGNRWKRPGWVRRLFKFVKVLNTNNVSLAGPDVV